MNKSSDRIGELFSSISPTYDLLNHILSFQIDRYWRYYLKKKILPEKDETFLDICAGTLDLSLVLSKKTDLKIISADISLPMLKRGSNKLKKRHSSCRIKPVCADALHLPMLDESLDGVVISFGIRNLEDLTQGLKEIKRVLKKSGRFGIIEFGIPQNRFIKFIYKGYLKLIPIAGRIISGNPDSYKYLTDSISEFPYGEELLKEMRGIGFTELQAKPLNWGICYFYCGKK